MKKPGISGNLRTGTQNKALLEVTRQVAPAGTEMTVAELSEFMVYNEDGYKQEFPTSAAGF